MSAQLFNVGDSVPVIKDGQDHLLEVVDITSQEAKSGTHFTYHMQLAAEVAEAAEAESEKAAA